MKMRFEGSDDTYTPPSASMSVEAAVLWLGRLNHPGIRRIVQMDGPRFVLDNRRRGCNRRSCVILVEDVRRKGSSDLPCPFRTLEEARTT